MSALIDSHEVEIILVNDGSDDDSSAVCQEVAENNREIVAIDLSFNFGEHNAVMAGLNYCSGSAAVIIDDDFQNPPSEIIKLIDELVKGYDVVYSCYEQKKHNFFRNLGSRFNNISAGLLIKKKKGIYLSSFKAINRFVIDEIIKYRGPYPYIDGLIMQATRNIGIVTVKHDKRVEGRSGYTLTKLIHLWLNMFTNFSILPLRASMILGFITAATGLVATVFFTLEKINNPDLPVGWASIIVVLLLVSGVQLIAIGMVGEYLGRLFLIVNRKPQYIIRKIIKAEENESKGNS
jgi:undecaprenyl-phosphate 4-deoxy-4-formamido-L-arabinose transferase